MIAAYPRSSRPTREPGVEHCPAAESEVRAVLIDVSVVNTGDAGGPLTAADDDSLG